MKENEDFLRLFNRNGKGLSIATGTGIQSMIP